MPTVDLLLGIAEFSIGLAGFSGIIAVFAGRDGRWAASDRQRGVVLILTALTPGFISFLALALGTIGLPEQIVWRLSEAIFGAAIVVSVFVVVAGHKAIPDSERQVFSPLAGAFVAGGSALNGAAQLFGAFGGFGSLTFTALFLGLVWQLLVGAIQFARIIFVRPDDTGGA